MKQKLVKGDVLNVSATFVFRNLHHDFIELDVSAFLSKVVELCNVSLNGILEVSKSDYENR